MDEDALEQLQTKMAFLERANAELSDVVFRQQRSIDALRDQIAALMMRAQSVGEPQETARTLEDERPPHY